VGIPTERNSGEESTIISETLGSVITERKPEQIFVIEIIVDLPEQ
jgi:hypothetical protein